MGTIEEKINNLANAFVDDEDDILLIKENLDRISEYANLINEFDSKMLSIMKEYEGEHRKYRIDNLHDCKKHYREMAIVAIRQLTRWAILNNVEPIYNGDINNECQIANFCVSIVKECNNPHNLSSILKY